MKTLSPPEAGRLLASDENAVLIDVRSTLEYEYVGHPPNALHVPLKEPPEWRRTPVSPPGSGPPWANARQTMPRPTKRGRCCYCAAVANARRWARSYCLRPVSARFTTSWKALRASGMKTATGARKMAGAFMACPGNNPEKPAKLSREATRFYVFPVPGAHSETIF